MIKTQSSCNDIFETGLMHMDDAKAKILSGIKGITGIQRVSIEQARTRTLAQTIISSINVPAHRNSAVDGFAVRAEDLPPHEQTGKLEIAGSALAGQAYSGSIKDGQCIRIMTGAPLPDIFDTVIMQEHTEEHENHILIDTSHRQGQNVRQAGEDLQQGQVVVHAGKVLTPPDIGLIASLGIAEIDVKRKLQIAIASTGDEIFSIGTTPGVGGVYDSNRYSLLAALDRPDIEIINLGIIKDNPETLLKTFNEAAEFADIIISTGGVSVGEADYTKTALQSSGQVDFWKVAIKPGRPLAFGHIQDTAFFGLPGNPVAVMVTFYLFVLPALEKMLGSSDKPIAPTLMATATEDMRKKPGRTEIPRGILEHSKNGEWEVKITGKQGSGILSSMSMGNAFIILEHGRSTIKKGEQVTVLPFSGLF